MSGSFVGSNGSIRGGGLLGLCCSFFTVLTDCHWF